MNGIEAKLPTQGVDLSLRTKNSLDRTWPGDRPKEDLSAYLEGSKTLRAAEDPIDDGEMLEAHFAAQLGFLKSALEGVAVEEAIESLLHFPQGWELSLCLSYLNLTPLGRW